MDPRTEPIRQDIDNIRESMTDKMGQIEAKIKGTVEDTTETLKRGLDVKYQVSQHPWAAMGVAVLAGYALGSMGGSESSYSSPSPYRYRGDYSSGHQPGEPMRYYGGNGNSSDWHSNQGKHEQSGGSQSIPGSYGSSSSYSSPAAYNTGYSSYGGQSSGGSQSYGSSPSHSSEKGFFDQVMGQLGIELDTFKTAAISSLVGLVRDTMKQNLPGVYQEAERLRQGARAQSHMGSSHDTAGSSYSAQSGMSSSYGSGSSPAYSSGSTMGSSYGSQSGMNAYGSGSSSAGSQSGLNASTYGTQSGEGEFYREADITEGSTTRHQRTPEIYPAGSSQSDTGSTQREIGRNPNYDMTPPSPEGTPGGRP